MGSRSLMSRVLRSSMGMTILPSSSIFLTIPVAFMSRPPFPRFSGPQGRVHTSFILDNKRSFQAYNYRNERKRMSRKFYLFLHRKEKMNKSFYVTTPIYYVNDMPHIGTAYTTVAADALARYHRLKGEEVFFLTGTDEHGQHVARAAERHGVSPQEWADRMVVHFTEVWKRLNISNDYFIRTTDPKHVEVARKFIQLLYDKGDIYLDTYEGWYCVPDESFWLPSQLVDGKCPQCGREVEMVQEENYFFRLSAYADRLLSHIESHPEFVQPEIRRNEVISFIKQGLTDQSISRKTITWGIPLPFDESQVMYVWFDALLNYISAIDYGLDEERFRRTWPADVHLIGKEILRFHAIVWPAMLMAADLPLPRQVFAHGWLTVEGEKMSKSKGNVISPHELIDEYGVDAYRYYFLREFSFGYDGNFSRENMTGRYNADLANSLGNMVSRVLAMVERYRGGTVPEPSDREEEPDVALRESAARVFPEVDRSMERLAFNEALQAIWNFLAAINRYVDETAAWDLAKDPTLSRRLDTVLYNMVEAVRLTALLVVPFLPATGEGIWRRLGFADPIHAHHLPEAAAWGLFPPGQRVSKGEPLFPRKK
ncbi:methionine--tRNA ligase [Candidatus Solincola tengchongensis]|uniref:methionine--tRNA ligase n=1 Tax=Candidatus Solincola tengchongensis TaxID=2900693 RepID=UPI003312FC93